MRLYSGNAMLAKVMAMYGRGLTPLDYENLLSRGTVGEVAAYLKLETGYASLLGEIREDVVRREQLENAIRRRALEIYLKLARYSHADDFLLELFLRRSEIEQLLQIIRLLSSGEMARYAVALPAYFSGHMELDLFKLAEARSFELLLELLRKTRYHRLLLPCRPPPGKEADVTACESALLTGYYADALALAARRYSGKSARAVQELLKLEIDLHNIVLLIRMKRFAGTTPQAIRPYLIGVKAGLSGKALEDLLGAGEPGAAQERLRAVPALRGCLPEDGAEIELGFECARKRVSHHALRYSRQPVAAVMGYMTLLRIETGNIIHIIEGVRYRLPAEEIRRCLVI